MLVVVVLAEVVLVVVGTVVEIGALLVMPVVVWLVVLV